MAAHREYLMASISVLAGLLAGPAPALAQQQLVPDEAALTEYVPVLPGAEGPTRAGPGAAAPGTTSQTLPARADGALSRLPAGREAALRRAATDPSLGAPEVTASAAQPASSAAIDARQRSGLSAVAGAVGGAPTSAIVLGVLLVLAVLAAAAARLRRGSPA